MRTFASQCFARARLPHAHTTHALRFHRFLRFRPLRYRLTNLRWCYSAKLFQHTGTHGPLPSPGPVCGRHYTRPTFTLRTRSSPAFAELRVPLMPSPFAPRATPQLPATRLHRRLLACAAFSPLPLCHGIIFIFAARVVYTAITGTALDVAMGSVPVDHRLTRRRTLLLLHHRMPTHTTSCLLLYTSTHLPRWRISGALPAVLPIFSLFSLPYSCSSTIMLL